MKNLDFFSDKPAQSGNNPFVAKLFFLENNMNGYFSINRFTEYLRGLNKVEAPRLNRAFGIAKEGADLNNHLQSSFDKTDGTQTIWLRFSHPKQKFSPISIPYAEELIKFFRDYQRGKIVPDFDLDELMEEARLTSSGNTGTSGS